MKFSSFLALATFCVLFTACSRAKDDANNATPPAEGNLGGPETSIDPGTAKEKTVATALYQAMVTVNTQDHALNEDLTQLYYLDSDVVKRKALLSAAENRSKTMSEIFKKSLKTYFEACAANASSTAYSSACASKAFTLNITNSYFGETKPALRPRDFCESYHDPLNIYACETANNLLWTAYKIEKANP